MVVLPASKMLVFEGFFSRQKLADKRLAKKTTPINSLKGNKSWKSQRVQMGPPNYYKWMYP